MPRTGSAAPGADQRLHWPSEAPGILTHRYASTRGAGCAAGAGPIARSGGLHQSWGSPAGWLPGVHGPRPLRLVWMTRGTDGAVPSSMLAYRQLMPDVLSAGSVEVSLHSP